MIGGVNNDLIFSTFKDHGIRASEELMVYLNSLPIDILAREVQRIIDEVELGTSTL